MSDADVQTRDPLGQGLSSVGWLAGILILWMGIRVLQGPAGPEGTVSQAPVQEAQALSPDLRLYTDVIQELRQGSDYYAAAHRLLPECGFPTGSVFNWRLPTSAWVTSLFPDNSWARYLLIVVALIACERLLTRESDEYGGRRSWILGIWLFGVVSWLWDGEAYLAQEVWAAVLLLAAMAARRCERPLVGASFEVVALCFRELVLPWVTVALVWAVWKRRWREAAVSAVGLGVWGMFLAWHAGQVHSRLTPEEMATGTGVSGWLTFGGAGFLASTMRMNGLLAAAPSVVGLGLLVAGSFGLVRRNDEIGRRLAVVTGLYVLTFAVVGQPFNIYWGLMYVPALGWGLAAWGDLLPRQSEVSTNVETARIAAH